MDPLELFLEALNGGLARTQWRHLDLGIQLSAVSCCGLRALRAARAGEGEESLEAPKLATNDSLVYKTNNGNLLSVRWPAFLMG